MNTFVLLIWFYGLGSATPVTVSSYSSLDECKIAGEVWRSSDKSGPTRDYICLRGQLK